MAAHLQAVLQVARAGRGGISDCAGRQFEGGGIDDDCDDDNEGDARCCSPFGTGRVGKWQVVYALAV